MAPTHGSTSPEAAGMGDAAEFFAGMGLVRRALEAGPPEGCWRTAYANDIDAMKGRMYRASFPVGEGEADALEVRDILEVRPEDVPPCSLWTASFPCTDLSLAGRGAGIHAGQSGAVWGLIALLNAKAESERPRWLLFENVTGLLSSHGGADVRELVGAVNAAGYGVDMVVVDAARFTPQSRPRLFLIATRLDDAAAPAPVDPAGVEVSGARPRAVIEAMRGAPDLTWHARTLPGLPASGAPLTSIIDDPPEESARWWSAERCEYFLNQVHPRHMAAARRMIEGPTVSYAAAFRRVRPMPDEGGAKRSVVELRTDGRAGCLRTPKGGSAKQILFRAGRGAFRVRHFTPVECARLQGVDSLPEGFGDTELLFGLGDAVCVPAVRWVLDVIAGPAGEGEKGLFVRTVGATTARV